MFNHTSIRNKMILREKTVVFVKDGVRGGCNLSSNTNVV